MSFDSASLCLTTCCLRRLLRGMRASGNSFHVFLDALAEGAPLAEAAVKFYRTCVLTATDGA
jgi:hypothetical protein